MLKLDESKSKATAVNRSFIFRSLVCLHCSLGDEWALLRTAGTFALGVSALALTTVILPAGLTLCRFELACRILRKLVGGLAVPVRILAVVVSRGRVLLRLLVVAVIVVMSCL